MGGGSSCRARPAANLTLRPAHGDAARKVPSDPERVLLNGQPVPQFVHNAVSMSSSGLVLDQLNALLERGHRFAGSSGRCAGRSTSCATPRAALHEVRACGRAFAASIGSWN